ncbi:MAG: (R)-citramalate synthase [Methanobacteriaceae archaeon]
MKVKVLDTTLRDGEQTPGVSLTSAEKVRIATKLDEIGIDIIEAGSAVTSIGERLAIKEVANLGLDAEIASFTRAVKGDIDFALDCNVDSIHLVVPTSPIHLEHKLKKTEEEVLYQAIECVEYGKEHGLIVELSAEDATRSNMGFLKEIFTNGINAGADRICACDTVGMLNPATSIKFYKELSTLNAPLSVHCHNDFGLAVANTLSAISVGATQFHSTVNGIGERAGNAAFEEVVVAINTLYDDLETNIKINELYSTSKLVARLTGVLLQANKSIVGENAFAHESGIHADGVLKNSSTYEPITPELVGHKRKFVMGKHIGSKGLENALNDLKIKVNKEQLNEVFKRVKSLGDLGKCVSDVDVQAIAENVLEISFDESIKLDELTVVSGNKVIPTASVKLNINNKEILEAGVGIGPVDAAISAINKAISDVIIIELAEYHVEAITGGTDALIDVLVRLKSGDRIISARSTQSDIINASVEAYLSGVNRLLKD